MKTPNCFELPSHFSRREFLHVGLVGGLGLTLADFLKIKAHGAQKFYETKEGPAKSVIHIYLPGGMAHQESWDPKPYAPLEYRGPFRSIPTKIPGVHFSENFKECAKIADKITVCRSMTHGEAQVSVAPTTCSPVTNLAQPSNFLVLAQWFLTNLVAVRIFPLCLYSQCT